MAKYYVAESTKPGDTIHYSELENNARKFGYASELEDPITKVIVTIDECSFSDYSGSTYERSNHRVMLKDKRVARYLVRLIGSHGSEGLAYIPRKSDGLPPKPVGECLAALHNSALLDDEDHSNLECEQETEAWESDGHDDFVKALTEYLDEQDPGFEHDLDLIDGEDFRDRMFELWLEGCEVFNVNGGSGCVHESSGVHFYIREWFKEAEQPLDRSQSWTYEMKATMRAKLEALAHETGFDCDEMRGALSVARDAFLAKDAITGALLIKQARIEASARQSDAEAELAEAELAEAELAEAELAEAELTGNESAA